MAPSKNKAFALLVAVFLAGVVSGAVVVRVYHHQVAEAGSAGIDLHSQPGVVANHLRQNLDLSEAQTAQIEDILDDCIMREANLLMQAKHLRTEARQSILELLDEQQRKRFNDVIDEVPTH